MMKMTSEGKRPLQIETEAVRVVIYTQQFKIIGNLHIPPHGRLSDFLNKTLGGVEKDLFLPVTQAECFSADDGKLKYVTEFLTIHKHHIHLVFPYHQDKKR